MEDENDIGGIRTPLDPASFSVSARVAMQLGRESVSSSSTAVVELVKNSYDADAENVSLKFSGLGTKSACLVISDDGIGMSEQELREYWLFIGTNNKKSRTYSKNKKRVQTGEKGLGRLGLDRLSRRSILQTLRKKTSDLAERETLFAESEGKALELTLDWNKYDVSGAKLEHVQHTLSALTDLNFCPLSGEKMGFPHGTRIILEDLTDEWDKDFILELREELGLLLSPFGELDDFRIHIESGLRDVGVNGYVEPDRDLLDLASWRVKADINEDENDEGKSIDVVSISVTSKHHNRSYKLDPIQWQKFSTHSSKPELKSKCGPLSFEFYVFIQDTQISEIKKFLRSNRGIRIYRDGFRVKPFGDPSGDNDWLKMSLKRAVNPAAISRKSWTLSFHQVVGAVFISRESNPSVVDQSNREGLVKGPSFDDLYLFADKVVKFFEGRAHEDYVSQHPPKEAKKPKVRGTELNKAINKIESAAKSGVKRGDESSSEVLSSALSVIKQFKDDQQSTEKELKDEIKSLEEEKRLLESLAALGVMTVSFGHDYSNDAYSVISNASRIKNDIDNPQPNLFSEERKREWLDNLLAGATRIDSYAKFAINHILPGKRRKKTTINLVEVVDLVMESFRPVMEGRHHISVSCDYRTNDAFVYGWVAGWESVLMNLLMNATWALSNKAQNERKVKLSIWEEHQFIYLCVEDSGAGIEAGTEEDIFRPGFSTKRDLHKSQTGTGMGLALVSSYLKAINGSIEVGKSENLLGAKFLVKMKKSSE